jgi:nucleoside-diphosphate-sugar epimerase
MKKVVVTGGAGFIGSHIVEELVKTGEYEVIAIDDLSTGNKKNLTPFLKKITFVEGSILDMALLQKAFKDVEYVFHQAALPSVPKSIEQPIETNMANVQGMLNVLVAAKERGVKRVVYASSSSVYGDSPVLPKVETMPYNPLSPYAAQKMMNEYYGKLFHKLFGLETVGLRYFNVFGPRQSPESKYAAVIPLFIKKILQNESPVINGDGSTTRDFTYVKNVVQANLRAALAKNVAGEVFNIALGDSVSLNELVTKINSELKMKVKPQYIAKRQGDIDHSKADITKAVTKLQFKPEYSFDAGLKHTIQALKELS